MVNDLLYWVWLSSLYRITPGKRKTLLDFFGDPKSIWEASEDDLKSVPFMTAVMLEQLTNKKYRANAEANLEKLQKHNIHVVKINDESYPYHLKNIFDPPVVLYVKGSIRKTQNLIAVVGSRKATDYGLSMAKSLSFELASAGFTVVSGMARGVDTYAHKGALKSKGDTIAVLGCGPDVVYPPENKSLMKDIADSGAVISEYLPGTQPKPYFFPARNRIISGVSKGVVVIEAGERSGSLITVNFALEQGREVFAVPGNIDNNNSIGTNRLIKDGAKIVTGVDDILEEINSPSCVNYNNLNEYKNSKSILDFYGLGKEEKTVTKCLLTEPMNVDMIAKRCGMSVDTVNSVLISLKIKGIVNQSDGKLFEVKNKF